MRISTDEGKTWKDIKLGNDKELTFESNNPEFETFEYMGEFLVFERGKERMLLQVEEKDQFKVGEKYDFKL